MTSKFLARLSVLNDGRARARIYFGTYRGGDTVTGYAVLPLDDEDVRVWFIGIPSVGGLMFGLS